MEDASLYLGIFRHSQFTVFKKKYRGGRMTSFIVIGVIVFVAAFGVISAYNGLVRGRN